MKKRVLLLIMCVFAITAASAQATSMAVVGDAVGGWPGTIGNPGPKDTNKMTTTDGVNWVIENLVVTTGNIKFRANNAWDADGVTGFNIGAPATGSAFPSGIGVNAGSSKNISAGIIPGTYKVTLNTTTLAYSFTGGAVIPVVKLVGSAVDGGSVDMIAANVDEFSVTVTLLDGTAQFNVDGTLVSDSAYPTGFAIDGGSAIPVPAGTYLVKYNNATAEYSIETPPNEAWSLTGAALANFGTGYTWGTDLVLNTTDGVTYTYPAITFEAGDFKFRIAGDYNTAKGGGAFPVGPTVGLEGDNITVSPEMAGTYDVTFNKMTGEYTFTGALSTKGFSNANFKVYPNPTNNVWNFTSANETIESIQIVNVLGKVVLSVSPKNNIANVDASALNSGIYFAKIATAKATQTIKLIKN